MSKPTLAQPLFGPEAAEGTRRVFVRDLVLPCRIGIHRHEQGGAQRVRINLDLAVLDTPAEDRYANVVCYETLIKRVRALVGRDHVNLVETLAERIAALCLEDRRVRSARVGVEKLDAFADAAAVGVEVVRRSRKP